MYTLVCEGWPDPVLSCLSEPEFVGETNIKLGSSSCRLDFLLTFLRARKQEDLLTVIGPLDMSNNVYIYDDNTQEVRLVTKLNKGLVDKYLGLTVYLSFVDLEVSKPLRSYPTHLIDQVESNLNLETTNTFSSY